MISRCRGVDVSGSDRARRERDEEMWSMDHTEHGNNKRNLNDASQKNFYAKI